ncbi:hypothetical protein [Legionella sp.]|uniref:hypothetical protein n=1 Tax=Legionella sp. TaxID=459 RepID=UPI000CA8CA65|nr:hypothetical protein [Legionella sp.]PJE14245.1 MAG: hypothetical protein CK430_05385 [Legionella sp.]
MLFVMQGISKKLLKIFNNGNQNKNESILYRIVDSYNHNGEEGFKVQRINTKAVFPILLQEIVLDLDILYGLHPIQSCFVGIEYSKTSLTTRNFNFLAQSTKKIMKNLYAVNRYGNNKLLYQDREGNLGFKSKDKDDVLMDPRDIVLSQSLIEEFDADQAFCIGILAGIRFVKFSTQDRKRIPQLKLVSG